MKGKGGNKGDEKREARARAETGEKLTNIAGGDADVIGGRRRRGEAGKEVRKGRRGGEGKVVRRGRGGEERKRRGRGGEQR